MANYVHGSYAPISNMDTKIIADILLEKPDKTRDYDIYSYYYQLVNGYPPIRKKGVIARSFTYTKNKIKENWFAKLIKWIRR